MGERKASTVRLSAEARANLDAFTYEHGLTANDLFEAFCLGLPGLPDGDVQRLARAARYVKRRPQR